MLTMAFATIIAPIEVDNVVFSPAVKPPASNKQLFLAGAGIRGLEMEGVFVKFTAIGVYLGEEAVLFLAGKWKGKSADELNESVDFFREFVTGPFEKFVRVTLVNTLTGQQYSEKVAENCAAILKSLGVYSQAEAEAIEQLLHIFKDQHFPPSSSILFTLLRNGSLAGQIPKTENGVIQNKLLAEAVLESIIGKKGVSPKARGSIASRLAEVFVHSATAANGN